MKTQLTKRSLMALALIAMLASTAGAVVLHDQSTILPGWTTEGFLNLVAGSPPFGQTVYSVCDVTVGGTGWIITDITIYVNALGGYDTSTAYINIFEKTGALPTEIPTDSHPVPVVATDLGNDTFSVTASGLSINLSVGNYWIGLTPAETAFNTSVHTPAASLMGDATPSYDIGGFPVPMWSNWNPGIDATILIEGIDDVVVSTENVTMGAVKALFR